MGCRIARLCECVCCAAAFMCWLCYYATGSIKPDGVVVCLTFLKSLTHIVYEDLSVLLLQNESRAQTNGDVTAAAQLNTCKHKYT